jgi:hypothetical protein
MLYESFFFFLFFSIKTEQALSSDHVAITVSVFFSCHRLVLRYVLYVLIFILVFSSTCNC